jgi:cysteinyl-tRNA synthetase
MRHLGSSFDIHTGGIDLIFPHHEDEIAQSEAATGQPFVQTWLHCAHLQMGGEKMARRTGNIALVSQILDRGIAPRALRYWLMSAHYRTSLAYTDDSLAAATAAVDRLDALLLALDTYRDERPDDPTLDALLDDTRARFEEALDDDLNISPALAALFDGTRDLNRRIDSRSLSTADAARAAAFVRDLDRVLGVTSGTGEELAEDLAGLLDSRATARAARDWAESDRLRAVLAERGIVVEDSRDGQRWRRASEPRRG